MLILDGHNVLFAMLAAGPSAGTDQLDAALARLVDALVRHFNVTGERAAVILDSRRLSGGARFERNLPGVRISYVHPPQTADDEVGRLVAASTAPRKLRVVSSDREVMRVCAARGAQVVDSRAFLLEMRLEAERTARDEAEQAIKTGRPDAQELAELLAAFGEAPNTPRLADSPTRLRPRPRK